MFYKYAETYLTRSKFRSNISNKRPRQPCTRPVYSQNIETGFAEHKYGGCPNRGQTPKRVLVILGYLVLIICSSVSISKIVGTHLGLPAQLYKCIGNHIDRNQFNYKEYRTHSSQLNRESRVNEYIQLPAR